MILKLNSIKENSALNQVQAHASTSSKYNFINTKDLVQEFEDNGFIMTSYNEQRPRKEDKKGFQKHLLSLTHLDLLDQNLRPLNQNTPQILLTNSHVGSSALKISFGVYRMACANGLILGDTFFQERFTHKVDHLAEIREIIKQAPERAREIEEIVAKLSGIQASEDFKHDLKVKTFELATKHLGNDEVQHVNDTHFFSPWRYADQGQDVYTLFNIAQEKMMRGGVRYLQDNQIKTVRTIKSIDKTLDLNKELFDFVLERVA